MPKTKRSHGTSALATRAVPDDQPREFLSHIDALTERLKPKRRPRDRNEPECSQQELKALAALGDRDTLTMSDLADILGVPLSTATHTIDKLVAKDLIARKRVPRDRRIVQVCFSSRGKRIHQFVLESRLAVAGDLLNALNPRSRKIFLQGLRTITEREDQRTNRTIPTLPQRGAAG